MNVLQQNHHILMLFWRTYASSFSRREVHRDTLLAATGKYGQYTGHVTVQFDTLKKRIVEMDATVYPSETLPVIEEDIRKVNAHIDAGKKKLDEPVFYNPTVKAKSICAKSVVFLFWTCNYRSYRGRLCDV